MNELQFRKIINICLECKFTRVWISKQDLDLYEINTDEKSRQKITEFIIKNDDANKFCIIQSDDGKPGIVRFDYGFRSSSMDKESAIKFCETMNNSVAWTPFKKPKSFNVSLNNLDKFLIESENIEIENSNVN